MERMWDKIFFGMLVNRAYEAIGFLSYFLLRGFLLVQYLKFILKITRIHAQSREIFRDQMILIIIRMAVKNCLCRIGKIFKDILSSHRILSILL